MTETAIAERPAPLDLALLKAVGLDRAAPEQRQLAIAIAERYGLDLMLKHLVLIEGRPYVTRDALIHIAHRSGQFDGIEVTAPRKDEGYWRCTATVWRKDMTHPFTYGGRYPATGGNAKFAEEMAVKVAESMALRRAFDVAAPVVEERWDVEVPAEPAPPRPTLAERAAEKAAAVQALERVEAKIIDVPEPELEVRLGQMLPDGIVNVEEVAEGAPIIRGLGMEAFAELCHKANPPITTLDLARALDCVPTDVGKRTRALTLVERGVLADELGIEWRA